ncbi:MAG: helix-turn-helix transcriptional regulator, partial [Selenomonadaceae bacterium]|nr:helix-turn-helix transcriptional regulator [Selenomonadaceae bacterium]
GEQLSVLLYLLSKMEYDNYLRVPQKTIAEKLNMTQSHVSRAMKLLKDMNIIVEEKREGTNKTYRFNPNIAHKGSYNYRDNVIEFNQKVDEKRRRRPKSNEDE